MSFSSAKVICTGCAYEALETYRPIHLIYKSADGRFLAASRTKGWCYACAAYSDIERLDSRELKDELVALENQRAHAMNRRAHLNRGVFSVFSNLAEKRNLKHQIMHLTKTIGNVCGLIEMADRRKSGARCLSCWSDDTERLEFDSVTGMAINFQHTCGGHLCLTKTPSAIRFSFPNTTYILDADGMLLGQE